MLSMNAIVYHQCMALAQSLLLALFMPTFVECTLLILLTAFVNENDLQQNGVALLGMFLIAIYLFLMRIIIIIIAIYIGWGE